MQDIIDLRIKNSDIRSEDKMRTTSGPKFLFTGKQIEYTHFLNSKKNLVNEMSLSNKSFMK